MTAKQLKALNKYMTVKMFEMVERGMSSQQTPQASNARAKAFREVLEEFNISEEQWKETVSS